MDLDPPRKHTHRASGFPWVEALIILLIFTLLAVIVVPQL